MPEARLAYLAAVCATGAGTAAGAAVALVARAPDNGGADEHAAAKISTHAAAIVGRSTQEETSGEAIEGDCAMTKGEPLPALGRTLYVVATPIGNLRDITLRAFDVLGQVDVIAAEDTRVTAVLIAHHGIRAQLLEPQRAQRTATGDRNCRDCSMRANGLRW